MHWCSDKPKARLSKWSFPPKLYGWQKVKCILFGSQLKPCAMAKCTRKHVHTRLCEKTDMLQEIYLFFIGLLLKERWTNDVDQLAVWLCEVTLNDYYGQCGSNCDIMCQNSWHQLALISRLMHATQSTSTVYRVYTKRVYYYYESEVQVHRGVCVIWLWHLLCFSPEHLPLK